MVIICITCQSAIFIKKFKEKRKDREIPFTTQISLSLNEEDNTEADQSACIKVNNQRWNLPVCGIYGYFFLLITTLFVSSSFVMMNSLLSGTNITIEEKAQIDDHLNEITIQILIPVVIYVRNSKLRQHVKYEIFN